MPISEQTTTVIAYLDKYSGFSLRKKNDMEEILEAASNHDEADKFNAAVFAGKVVWNLYHQLRKAASPDVSYHNMEQEFAKAINELRGLLLHFSILSENDAVKKRFEETYLAVNPGTMRNVVDLAHDLARLKDLQGDEQRKQ